LEIPAETGVPSIILQDKIDLADEDTVIRPPPLTMYNDKPYVFKSSEEFFEFVKNVKTMNLDALYKQVKSICKKYVDADDFHLSICAADTVFTNFQDRLGLTHYFFFVGEEAWVQFVKTRLMT
jgi:hypothetical protein